MRYTTATAVAALLTVALATHPPAEAATPSANEQPSQGIEIAAQQTLKELDADRESYRKDPAKIQCR
jgi:ABC-type transporter MlaC component